MIWQIIMNVQITQDNIQPETFLDNLRYFSIFCTIMGAYMSIKTLHFLCRFHYVWTTNLPKNKWYGIGYKDKYLTKAGDVADGSCFFLLHTAHLLAPVLSEFTGSAYKRGFTE